MPEQQSNDAQGAPQANLHAALHCAHRRISANTVQTLDAAAFLYALVELLEERGLISIAELDERKRLVGARLAEQYRRSNRGVLLQDLEQDKYSLPSCASLDCAARLPLCKAACCRLPFALSRQDLNEGVVRWDLEQPYLIAQAADGYCGHLDHDCLGCTIYAQRPLPCRAYDCRSDTRIWLDYDAGKINPLVERADWPACLMQQNGASDD